MQKLLFYFVSLFVLFFACSQNQTEQESNKANVATTSPATSVKEDIPVPTPIPPPIAQDIPEHKHVKQAPTKDLVYPKTFKEFGISKYPDASIKNNVMIDNSQGMYGQRIKLACTGNYEAVLKFYATNLEQNGWTQNTAMNKSVEDEHVTFFATNYTKDNYTLMHSVTALGPDNVSVMQILKEN